MEDLLLYFAYKYHGNYSLIYNAVMTNEKVFRWQIEECKKKVYFKYTTIVSEDYPKVLKKNYYPPFVLFYTGNLEILNQRCAEDFRSIDCDSRLYSTSRKDQFFIGVENPDHLNLLYSFQQEAIIRK